jgi:phage tail-like protein
MAIFRQEPYSGMNFEVQISGTVGGIFEVVLPEARIETYEYRNGNDPPNAARNMQTITRYGRLTLRRGADGSLDWFQWWQNISSGSLDRRLVTVNLFDEAHNGPVLTWVFAEARPVNYGFSPLNGLAASALVESIELAFDSMVVQ